MGQKQPTGQGMYSAQPSQSGYKGSNSVAPSANSMGGGSSLPPINATNGNSMNMQGKLIDPKTGRTMNTQQVSSNSGNSNNNTQQQKKRKKYRMNYAQQVM